MCVFGTMTGNTRLELVLQGNNDSGLIEQIRNESYTLQLGNKRYELSNHLGNVLAVVSDKKVQSDGAIWSAVVVSAQDYYPFGMAMPGRSSGAYRYGFNGKETDPETGLNDFGARLYDGRLGRWRAVDPLATQFPAWSPYNSMTDNPIFFIDPDGKQVEGDYYNNAGKYLGSDGKKDDKVYMAEKALKTSDGKTQFINSKELTIRHSEFLNMAATAYAETDAHNNKEDIWGIASAIRNRIARKRYDTYTQLKSKEKNYAYVWTDGNTRYKGFNACIQKKKFTAGMELAIAGVLNAYTGGEDYANGGDQWDGADVITYTNHYTTRKGVTDPEGLVPIFINNCRAYFSLSAESNRDSQEKVEKINMRQNASFTISQKSVHGYQYKVSRVGYTTIFYLHEYEE